MGERYEPTGGARLAPTSELPIPSAASGSGSGQGDDRDRSEQKPKRARRAFLTQNACRRCRQKKSKCDGRRPTCSRCAKYTNECTYDVAQEGLTRMQNLQQQLENKTTDYDRLQNLFSAMEQGTDEQATAILARLRLNADVSALLEFAQITRASSLNVSHNRGVGHSIPQPDGAQPLQPQDQDQHQPPPGYRQGWDPNTMPDIGDWGSWNEGTDEASTPQSTASFHDDVQVQQVQRFPQNPGRQEQYHPPPANMMVGQGQQPDAMNWQSQAGVPPEQPPMGEAFQYGDYPPGSRSRAQIQGSQYLGGVFQGGPFEGRAFQGGQFQGGSFQGGRFQGGQVQAGLYQAGPYQYQSGLWQGQPSQGQPPQGQPPQGQPPQGQPPQGQPPQGQPPQGQPSQGDARSGRYTTRP